MDTLRQQFLKYVAQTSDAPMLLSITKAEGVYLYAANGKKYIDLISGIGVSSYGHGNPKIIEAIQQQAEKGVWRVCAATTSSFSRKTVQ